ISAELGKHSVHAKGGIVADGSQPATALGARLGEVRTAARTGRVARATRAARHPKWADRQGMGQLIGVADNPVTRKSQRIGNDIEHYFRSALAFDHWLKAGVDPTDARQVQTVLSEGVEKVHQMHFDYSDLSNLEQQWMRRIVPFWT